MTKWRVGESVYRRYALGGIVAQTHQDRDAASGTLWHHVCLYEHTRTLCWLWVWPNTATANATPVTCLYCIGMASNVP